MNNDAAPALLFSGAQVFNGYIIAHSAFALWELGIFQLFADNGTVDIVAIASETHNSSSLLIAICDTLAAGGFLAHAGNSSYSLTEQGKDLLKDMGYFVWAVGGYGNVLNNMHLLSAGRQRYGQDVKRNDFYVAKGSQEAGEVHVLPYVAEVLKTIKMNMVIDIGCGNAGFLVGLCKQYPGLKALGIDASSDACTMAQHRIQQAGLADRIQIVCSSFQTALRKAEGQSTSLFSEADLVTSFFMMHDLMAKKAEAVQILRTLRDALPTTAQLLIADTMKSEFAVLKTQPIFSLGFELNHALMGVQLWYKQDYEQVFQEAGLEIAQCLPLGVPSSWVYLLR